MDDNLEEDIGAATEESCGSPEGTPRQATKKTTPKKPKRSDCRNESRVIMPFVPLEAIKEEITPCSSSQQLEHNLSFIKNKLQADVRARFPDQTELSNSGKSNESDTVSTVPPTSAPAPGIADEETDFNYTISLQQNRKNLHGGKPKAREVLPRAPVGAKERYSSDSAATATRTGAKPNDARLSNIDRRREVGDSTGSPDETKRRREKRGTESVLIGNSDSPKRNRKSLGNHQHYPDAPGQSAWQKVLNETYSVNEVRIVSNDKYKSCLRELKRFNMRHRRSAENSTTDEMVSKCYGVDANSDLQTNRTDCTETNISSISEDDLGRTEKINKANTDRARGLQQAGGVVSDISDNGTSNGQRASEFDSNSLDLSDTSATDRRAVNAMQAGSANRGSRRKSASYNSDSKQQSLHRSKSATSSEMVRKDGNRVEMPMRKPSRRLNHLIDGDPDLSFERARRHSAGYSPVQNATPRSDQNRRSSSRRSKRNSWHSTPNTPLTSRPETLGAHSSRKERKNTTGPCTQRSYLTNVSQKNERDAEASREQSNGDGVLVVRESNHTAGHRRHKAGRRKTRTVSPDINDATRENATRPRALSSAVSSRNDSGRHSKRSGDFSFKHSKAESLKAASRANDVRRQLEIAGDESTDVSPVDGSEASDGCHEGTANMTVKSDFGRKVVGRARPLTPRLDDSVDSDEFVDAYGDFDSLCLDTRDYCIRCAELSDLSTQDSFNVDTHDTWTQVHYRDILAEVNWQKRHHGDTYAGLPDVEDMQEEYRRRAAMGDGHDSYRRGREVNYNYTGPVGNYLMNSSRRPPALGCPPTDDNEDDGALICCGCLNLSYLRRIFSGRK